MNLSDSFVGQKRIKKIIAGALESGKVGHAYLISGEDGMGKHTVAYSIARTLLCEGSECGFCGQCKPCRLFESDANPDFIMISGEKGKVASVSDIREKLVDEAVIRPMFSDRKVIIVDKVEQLSAGAQNCMLKTLEEPPSYVTILLLTSNTKAVLQTIRSRVIELPIEEYSNDELKQIVQRHGVDAESHDAIVRSSGGNPGKALKLSGDNDYISVRTKIIDYCTCLSGRAKDTYSFIECILSALENNKDKQEDIFNLVQSVYRDMMIASAGGSSIINVDYEAKIKQQSKKADVRLYVKCLEIIEKTRLAVRGHGNLKVCINDMLTRIQEEINRWLK